MRFLRFTLILGTVQLIVLLAIQILIFRSLDLGLARIAQVLIVPQFEALVLCLVVPQRPVRVWPSWSTSDTGWVIACVTAAAFTSFVPASRGVLPAIALLVAAAFLVTARCLVRITLGLLLVAAGTDLLHPWIARLANGWLPNRPILFQDLVTYGLGTIALVLAIGALERLLSPEYGTAYRSLICSLGAAVVMIDIIVCNYASHPYLSPPSSVAAGICGAVFSISIATTAVLLRFRPRVTE